MIVLDGLDFLWKDEVIEEVKIYWNSGMHINKISELVKRSQAETFLLLLDLSLKNQIKKRDQGILGF